MNGRSWVSLCVVCCSAWMGGCDRGRSSGTAASGGGGQGASTTTGARDAVATAATGADGATAGARAGMDAGTARPAQDAAAPSVLTIRVVNAGTTPMNILMNQDLNEMMHTRQLPLRRIPDASGPLANGVLVKFFTVGEMPLCTAPRDAGVGYGGLGQPEPRAIAPGQSLDFEWDGQQRREINSPERGGVCVQIGAPEPGRYRFEFDQPYNPPNCTRPTITLPLSPDAGRVVEIRCTPRVPNPEERRGGGEN